MIYLFLLLWSSLSSAANETWVVLGDSISSGYGIPAGQGWVALFQKKLSETGSKVKIINESISGDTTAGGLSRLPEVLDRLKPQKIIVELGGNDGLRGLSLDAMKQNLSKIVAFCLAKNVDVMLLGMRLPPNYGRKYNDLFEKVYASISSQHNVSLLPFLLDGVGGQEEYMQADRIHPNPNGQKLLMHNVWTALLPVI
ncbi:MAG: arylesterase [Moraxellaceae bacterium]|nr:MAG: arylesterase [Moraxellaceae bacterium]